MNFLFLDIDGVLNSSRSILARTGVRRTSETDKALQDLHVAYIDYLDENNELPYNAKDTFATIDPVAVDLLNRLLMKSGAALVLSSSHRAMFQNDRMYGSARHLHTLGLYLTAMGIRYPLYGIIPRLFTERGAEVQRYLEDMRADPEDGFRYVILDDAKDFHQSQPLVWCDAGIGFSHENYFTACKQLLVNESTIIF